MEFLNKNEKKISNKFLKKGYIINQAEDKKSLNYITKLFNKSIKKIINQKVLDINYLHKYISIKDLNNFRLDLIHKLNQDISFRFNYFNLARNAIYYLAGNELMMQKNINLSIQFPEDDSSLLPIHSDVWSGDSPYEINLWLPLVNCYKTKSMYILDKRKVNFLKEKLIKMKSKSSLHIYKILKKDLKWLKVDYGKFLLFDQSLPHGNVVNHESQTRVSMNCRFKSIFSPYGDKKVGEFFTPITCRAITDIGLNFRSPF